METEPACYVNKQGPQFPGCLGKRNKTQRACVLSAAAPASEEGSQGTHNPGELDGSQETLREPGPGRAEPAAPGAGLPEAHRDTAGHHAPAKASAANAGGQKTRRIKAN